MYCLRILGGVRDNRQNLSRDNPASWNITDLYHSLTWPTETLSRSTRSRSAAETKPSASHFRFGISVHGQKAPEGR